MKLNRSPLIVRLESDNRVIQTIELNDKWEPITIGRSPDNTWIVNDPSIDPHHARIVMKRNKLILEDLGKSGIFLLEKKIEDRIVMHPGPVYRIGRGNTKLFIEKIVSAPRKQGQEQYHRLEQLTGENKGRIYQIRKKDDDDFLVIGSGDQADIVIQESWISREHALLEVKDEGCFIYDGNKDGKPSRNGTKVAQEPVSVRQGNQAGRQLQDGQIVSMAHVDLRFWDKDAVHVRSHFFLRLAVVLITIAVVLTGFFAVQTFRPTSKGYRIKAEKSAAAGNFAKAWEYIELAQTARGADDDAFQRTELIRKLEIWENTATQWAGIRQALLQPDGQNWRQLNSRFATLIYSGNENWKWNTTTALQEMKVAQNAHELISAMLTADDFIRSSNRDFKYMDRLLKTLSTCYTSAQESPVQFSALLSAADQTQKELVLMQGDHKRATEIMDSFDSAEKTAEVYESIRGIRTRNAEHIAERNQKKLPTSSAIVQYCDDVLIPLELLHKSEMTLQRNYEAIAKMDFDQFTETLSLPTPQQFMVANKLADRCTEMQQVCDRQAKIVRQLNSYRSRFLAEGFSADQDPPVLKKLFDEETLEKVLSCDCLDFKQPGFQEKEATSEYDAVLGVYAFCDYLNSLDGVFDTMVFDDRFRPTLFQSTEVFDLLNTYLDLCFARNDPSLSADMAIIRGISSGNQVMALASSAETLLDKKKSLLRKLMQIALSQPDERKGIIAGGMVCWLKDKTVSFVPDDFREQVLENHQKLHRKLASRLEKIPGSTPEERKEIEKTILSLGIPGDSVLRQPWSDHFSEKK